MARLQREARLKWFGIRHAAILTLGLLMGGGASLRAAAPVVSLSTPNVLFIYESSSLAPATRTVTVTSTQPVTVNSGAITYVSGILPGWLTVVGGGPTPAQIQIGVDPSLLPTGEYFAQVQLNPAAPVDPSSTLVINVYVAVVQPGPSNEVITANPTALSFAYQIGGTAPAPQTLAVSTLDGAPFSLVAQTLDGGKWLNVSLSASPSPANLTISIDPTQLTNGGTYSGSILLLAPGEASTTVPVTVTVTQPVLNVNPQSFSFTAPQYFGLTAPQTLQVTSTPAFTFAATATSSGGWLTIDTNAGKTPATILVRANVNSLLPGSYTGSIRVETSPGNSLVIPATLTVGPPQLMSLQPAALSFTYQTGSPNPAPQTIKVTSTVQSSGLPFSVVPSTAAGGSWLTSTVNPSVTPGQISVGINPAGLAPGMYSGTLTVSTTALTPLGDPSTPQTVPVSLTVTAPPPPAILSIGNAASPAGNAVSAGEIVTIFGSNLGPAVLATPQPGTFPTTLSGTAVTFDGIAAPIFYTSAAQVSVQIPYGISTTQTAVRLSYNGGASTTTLLTVPAAPGLFTANASGQGQAAALNGDFTLNSAANPAARGAVLVLYGTGEGKTAPASVEGAITALTPPFPAPVNPVSVSIGGLPAQILYQGETPGAVSGLLQVNVIVPAGVQPGAAVPVTLTINGQTSSSAVTVAIK